MLIIFTLKKIPESELEIMKFIWDNSSHGTSKEIITVMEQKRGWKNTTTLTLLSRLVDKEFLIAKKDKKITYYTAIASEKSYLGLETSSFFKTIHGNSLKNFITTLHQNNDITDNDLDELEEWIRNRCYHD